MARYTAVSQAFLNSVLVQIGDEIESDTSPGPAFVLSSSFDDSGGARTENVEAPGFVVEIDGKLVRSATATRLVGRSLHELRAFKP